MTCRCKNTLSPYVRKAYRHTEALGAAGTSMASVLALRCSRRRSTDPADRRPLLPRGVLALLPSADERTVHCLSRRRRRHPCVRLRTAGMRYTSACRDVGDADRASASACLAQPSAKTNALGVRRMASLAGQFVSVIQFRVRRPRCRAAQAMRPRCIEAALQRQVAPGA